MPEVRYISEKDFRSAAKAQTAEWTSDKLLDYFAEQIEQESGCNDGFIKLQSIKGSKVLYFNRKINAILGDLSDKNAGFEQMKWHEIDETNHILTWEDNNLVNHVGPFSAGIMNAGEFKLVFESPKFNDVCKNFGWTGIWDRVYAVINPAKWRNYIKHGNSPVVHYVPVHRCMREAKAAKLFESRQIAEYVLKNGFLPCSGNIYKFLNDKAFAAGVYKYWGGSERKSAASLVPPVKPDDKQLKEIRGFFRNLPVNTANLPAYNETIFQMDNGSWDLYKFVGLGLDDLDPASAPWFDVSGKGLYARDPKQDVASDTEMVAIDFGTKSTTVAVFDRFSNIALLPVGSWTDPDNRYENPTILRFRDSGSFMKAYRSSEGRPLTSFNDISVSYSALRDFEDSSLRDNVLQYLPQLKQWVNDPGRKPFAQDNNGVVKLRDYTWPPEKDEIDPIEIYAYYVGLNINNMHRSKIYLKYLLSYSSTYLQSSCEQIRKSFEAGIKKSLPLEIIRDPDLMADFEVRLWCDEATAYVVCALNRYIEAEYGLAPERQEYEPLLQSGGISYGVFDLGGGTLDFSFGVYSREEDGSYRLRQLGRGGGSKLGCENILEELAFSIYRKNQKSLYERNIKCAGLPGVFGGTDQPFVGTSSQARENTVNLINILREIWIDPKKCNPDEQSLEFLLKNENNEFFECTISSWSNSSQSKKVNLAVDSEYIEKMFERKISDGVELFFDSYREVEWNGADSRGCHIFLAGNASRSSRIKKCFKGFMPDGNYTLVEPLPTDKDRMLAEETGGCVPNAKSGVVHGLLLSRPGALGLSIENLLPLRTFLFFIGYRVQDPRYGMKGIFKLSVHIDDINGMPVFHLLCPIRKTEFELLYSDDPRYGLRKKEVPVTVNMRTVQLSVPQKYVGLYFYGRVLENSSCVMEVGVSPVNNPVQGSVEEVIGVCDFSSKGKVFQAIKAPPKTEEAEEINDEIPLDTNASENEEKSDVQESVYTSGAGDIEQPGQFPYDIGVRGSDDRFHIKVRAGDITREVCEMGGTTGEKFEILYAVPGGEVSTYILELGRPGEDKLLGLLKTRDESGRFNVQVCIMYPDGEMKGQDIDFGGKGV